MAEIFEYENVDIGDYIEAIALSPYTKNNRNNSWYGYSKQINPKIDLELIISDKGDAQVGFSSIFRVININSNKIIAINSLYFCSKPIDSNVENIINKFITQINEGFDNYGKNSLLTTISKIKSFYHNCWTINSCYRFEFYYGMDRPTREEINIIVNILSLIKAELKNKEECDYTRIESLIEELLTTNIMQHLLSLKKYLKGSAEKLKNPKYGKKEKSTVLDEKSVKRILSEQEKEKLNWACSTHEKTLQILMDKLKQLKYKPEEGIFIDCFAYIKTIPTIFEIKSITEKNELSQIRAAVSQLYEYSYRHNCPEASLWIVLSQKPNIEWMLDYLIKARNINVLWVENNVLVGPSLKLL